MKVMLVLGKLVTGLAWVMMLYNLVVPFAGNISVVLNILFAMTIFMHCFQTLIFHTMFKPLLQLKKSDYLQVFLFGVFSLLQYRKQVMDKQAQL
ncbi:MULTISPECIES: DUF1145 domain-containing protein [unclassified Shewanella]|uniref:DUF1145 domain-containing protein n=1 Tax=unclassified Shewanella TaxID=196818 RepID=UPI001BBADB73|nr:MULTISPECIES: DUF1145 domain-containing protein [unclassified Shewanella]GIU16582.1 hypothetical protein TUM4444_29500 [Shewanella sp. MBTL60-112-B1]GIU39990.1 hypothetical protein TUM4445_38160 [Shewanella sp. MBTL60-112-B2]